MITITFCFHCTMQQPRTRQARLIKAGLMNHKYKIQKRLDNWEHAGWNLKGELILTMWEFETSEFNVILQWFL